MGRTLRVALLGVRVQEPRRYHVSLQVLAPGQAPVGVVVLNDAASDKYKPEQVARTETSELSANPEFLNRVFVLRLSEPLGHSLAPQISLHCNLFALPSANSTTPGAMVAGKEVDELMGAATVQIRGETAARLLRGERVTLPVVLNDGKGDDSHGTRDLMASMYGASRGKEILLELQLLDAQVTLPRDTYALQASNTQHGPMGMSRPPVECTLMVLVTRAENMPTVRSADDGSEQAPSTFVAAKSLRDVRNSVTAQAMTHVCPSSTSPVWGQLLQVKYHEDELSSEELHLAIVNDNDSRLMLKATLPVSNLIPQVHYNLKLLLPGGPLGSHVALYVTLCLVDCPRREVRHLKAQGSGISHIVSSRLASSTLPLHSLGPAMTTNAQPGSQVMAVWSMVHAPPISQPAATNKPATPPPGPSADGAPAVPDASASPVPPKPPMPLQTALPSPIGLDNLYVTMDTSNVASVNQRLEEMSKTINGASQGGGGVPLDVMPVHVVPPIEGTQADQLVWPPDHMATLLHRLEDETHVQLQLHLIPLSGTHTIPMAVLNVPRSQLGTLKSQPMLVEGLPLRNANNQDAVCSLEMGLWRSASYQEHLQKQRLGEEDDLSTQGPGMMSAMSWQDKSGGAGNMGAAASVLETLVDDLMAKQLALERVARHMDGLECRTEMMGWRLSDAQHKVKIMEEDTQKLRQLLHEEKEACRLPIQLENSMKLSKEDLIERTEAALGAYGRERRRNTELVHRLQQMHGEQVDMLEMKKRYMELQAAHMEMTKIMTTTHGPVHTKLATYRQTVKTQEEVITNLENLLRQTVSKARNIPTMTAENQRLRDELRSRSMIPSVDPGSLEEVADLRNANEEMVQENVQIKLKLKQAEDRTVAARDELVSAIKRYAAEIADLKWRLAEKDAQMMGGFGSPARLQDLEDDLGIPKVNPAAFAHIASATGVGNSLNSPGKPPRSGSAEGAPGQIRPQLRALSAGSQQASPHGQPGTPTKAGGQALGAGKQAWPAGPDSPSIKAVPGGQRPGPLETSASGEQQQRRSGGENGAPQPRLQSSRSASSVSQSQSSSESSRSSTRDGLSSKSSSKQSPPSTSGK